MAEKSIIIVGAGISGLSAGCYARMNGYRTTIFEMHSIPGGLCTAWTRKGYKWDISMHFLPNSRRGPLRKMWEELGITDNRQFFYHRDLMKIESGEKKITIGINRKELERAMLAISPDDKKMVKKYTGLLYGRSLINAATLKPAEVCGFIDHIKVIRAIFPFIGTFIKYSKYTLQDFALKFKDPFLQKVARFIIDSPGWPMLRFPASGISGYINSSVVDAGMPLGGSQKVLFDMADRYKKLGGEIYYKSRVKELIIENEKVTGVRLENGSEHRAGTVIWTADGHHLIYDMLGSRYLNDEIREMYEKWIPVKPLVHVMIGVNRDMSKEPHRLVMEIDKPIRIANEDHKWLYFIHHCFDSSTAPAGKSSVEVWFATDYDYWEALSKDSQKYKEEKDRVAGLVIEELNKRWPGFAEQVEVIDVPTPVTYNRYTGNWRGSPDGWYVTSENMAKHKMVRTLPGLKGLFMAGQWTAPYTGTVMAAVSGRQIIELLCWQDEQEFKTGS